MSLNGTRAEFKAILDTVEGVTGYVKRPAQPRTGDAWPMWRGGERDEQSGLFAHTWAVGVFLPQDEQASNDWVDANAELIVDALESQGLAFVDNFDPANFGPESSPQYGLLFTLRSN